MKSKEKWKKLTKNVKSLKNNHNKYAQSYSRWTNFSSFKEEYLDGESIYLVGGSYCEEQFAKHF